MVLWIIGLSGAGKTTTSRLVYDKLKPRLPNLVLIDGDVMRQMFPDIDHTIEGRRKNAERLSRLSQLLASQNIHVIAAVLSIFPEWQKWNRENMPGYTQVYLRADLDRLAQRDTKGIYRRAVAGELKNVVGVDLTFPEPFGTDLICDTSADKDNFDDVVADILELPEVQNTAALSSTDR